MASEGMVHALEKIHQLLQPNGRLLDIHPFGQPPPIEVRLDGEVFQAGWLQESDEYVEYEQANQAVAGVVKQGLFVVEERSRFAFETHASSLAELQAFLAENWKDAIVEEQVAGQIEAYMASIAQEKVIVIREVIQASRLRPLFIVLP